MRAINSFIKLFSSNNEPESMIKFNHNLSKFRSFIINNEDFDAHFNKYGSMQKVLSLDFNNHLPFKFTSVEFFMPLLMNEDAWGTVAGVTKPMHIGSIFIENDDFSIDELFIGCSYEENEKLMFNDLSFVPCRPFCTTAKYSDYNEFFEKNSMRLPLHFLNSKEVRFGQSIKHIEFNRKGRHPDFVKRISFVKLKRNKSESLGGVKIDFQHTFDVMGHWRDISPKSVGKNREGKYSINGKTWVNNFTKGKGIYIKKDRILREVNSGI